MAKTPGDDEGQKCHAANILPRKIAPSPKIYSKRRMLLPVGALIAISSTRFPARPGSAASLFVPHPLRARVTRRGPHTHEALFG
jgi:hypothetical protein